MVYCAAWNCKNRDENGIKTNIFPGGERDRERRAIWKAFVNRANWSPGKNARLCNVSTMCTIYTQTVYIYIL